MQRLLLSTLFGWVLANDYGSGTPFPIGANLGGTSVYVDVMKETGWPWGSWANPWAMGSVDCLEDGTPIGDAFGIVILEGIVPEIFGDWHILWNGPNGSEFQQTWGAPGGSIRSHTWDDATNQHTVIFNYPEGDASQGTWFRWNGCAGASGNESCSNIKCIRPGYPPVGHQTFTNFTLNYFKQFNTFRFMDWMDTNNIAKPVSWVNRTLPTFMRWQIYESMDGKRIMNPTGTPYEVIIELCNTLKVNPWINVPLMADQDFTLQLAKLFQELLDPSLILHVEYANELWNWAFPAAGIMQSIAVAEITDNPNSSLSQQLTYKTDNVWNYGSRMAIINATRLSDTFRSVYGDCMMGTHVRMIFGSQLDYGNGITYKLGLNFISDTIGAPSHYFHACTGAPYLGYPNTSHSTTPEENIALFNAALDIVDWTMPTQICLAYNLSFYAYEGCEDGPDPQFTVETWDLPEYIPFVQRYLRLVYSQGFDLFNWFTLGRGIVYGTWVELNNTETGRYKAITSFFEGVNYQDIPDSRRGDDVPFVNHNGLACDNMFPVAYIRVNNTNGGIYQLSAEVEGLSGTQLSIRLDGREEVATYVIPEANPLMVRNITLGPGWHSLTFATNKTCDIALHQGWNLTLVSELSVAPPKFVPTFKYSSNVCSALQGSPSTVQGSLSTIQGSPSVSSSPQLHSHVMSLVLILSLILCS